MQEAPTKPGTRRGKPRPTFHLTPMTAMRFNVFGRILAIQRTAESWQVNAVGTDGKLGPAGFVIPDFVAEHELVQYLADLFHESARPGRDDVRRVS